MLTSKQRAYLIGLAADLTPVVQIGRAGVTPEVQTSLEETFNTRELVKLNVQKNAPEEPASCAEMLAGRTHSEVVKVIGRKIVLYKKDKDHPKLELPKA